MEIEQQVQPNLISPLSSPTRKSKLKEANLPTGESQDSTKKSASPTSITHPALERFRQQTSSKKSNEAIKLKTIMKGSSLSLPSSLTRVSEVKEELSSSSSISSADIMLVSQGKDLDDDTCIKASTAPIYAVVRSKATSNVRINLRISDGPVKTTRHVEFPASMKIYQLKRELSKLSKISEHGMRCIIGARVLRDENLLGDYILSVAAPSSSLSSSPSSPRCEKRVSGSSIQRTGDVVMYVNKTINLKKDVDINLHMLGGSCVKSHFEISTHIAGLREVLKRETPFLPTTLIKFCINISGYLVAMDENRSLIDYGFTGEKTAQIVNIFILPADVPAPRTCDLSNNFILSVDPASFFTKSTLNDENSLRMKSSMEEVKKDLESVSKRAEGIAAAITKRRENVATNISYDGSGHKCNDKKNRQNLGVSNDTLKRTTGGGGLFSRLKKGFLGSSSKKQKVQKIKEPHPNDQQYSNPYDDPDSPLNQMD